MKKKNPDCILYFWAYLNMSKERKTTCRIHVVDVISLSVPDEHNDPFILFWEKKNRKTTFLTMELCRRIKTVYIIYAEFPIKDLGILFVAVGHDRHETVGRPSSFNYNDFNRFYWGFFLSCLWILSRLFYWYVAIPPPPQLCNLGRVDNNIFFYLFCFISIFNSSQKHSQDFIIKDIHPLYTRMMDAL
jgi:hypothetical protein